MTSEAIPTVLSVEEVMRVSEYLLKFIVIIFVESKKGGKRRKRMKREEVSQTVGAMVMR